MRPMSQLIIKRMLRLLSKRLRAQYLTCQRGYLANGPLGLGLALGVSVTILQICNPEHWNKLTCPQGLALQGSPTMAQFLHQGPAQKSGSPQGFQAWDYPVQEPQFLLHAKHTTSFSWQIIHNCLWDMKFCKWYFCHCPKLTDQIWSATATAEDTSCDGN